MTSKITTISVSLETYDLLHEKKPARMGWDDFLYNIARRIKKKNSEPQSQES